MPAVLGLWRQMMEHHRRLDARFATSPHGPQAFEGYVRKCLRSRSCRVLVAEEEDRVAGYAIVTILENQKVFALGRFGFVVELCVDESARRQGIGRRLWEAAVAWCREKGVTVVQMNVSTLNEEARRFWRSVGCREYLEVLWYDIGAKDSTDPGNGSGRDPGPNEEF
jgi:ribosomal protein S18 acetylase RimI-like enzyme